MTDLAKQIFWDYNMTDEKMRRLLKTGTDWEKYWVASRILERAPFNQVWKFLTLKQVREMFPKLWVRPQLKKIWVMALKAWDENEKNSKTHIQNSRSFTASHA